MQAPVPGRAHMIKFFEGMCKMLPAVVSGRKGNIRNVQSTVAQKKGGLLHTLAVDISVDGAAVFFCKKRLEVGFVDPCICGRWQEYQCLPDNARQYSGALFLDKTTSLGVPAGAGAEGKLCKHAAETEERREILPLCISPELCCKKVSKIFQAVSEIPGIRAGAESPGGVHKVPEPGKSGILFQKKLQSNRAFFGSEGKFQIQDRAGKTIRDFKPVRDIRPDKDKLSGFQREFRVLCAHPGRKPGRNRR